MKDTIQHKGHNNVIVVFASGSVGRTGHSLQRNAILSAPNHNELMKIPHRPTARRNFFQKEYRSALCARFALAAENVVLLRLHVERTQANASPANSQRRHPDGNRAEIGLRLCWDSRNRRSIENSRFERLCSVWLVRIPLLHSYSTPTILHIMGSTVAFGLLSESCWLLIC